MAEAGSGMQDYAAVTVATGDGVWLLELALVNGGPINRLEYTDTRGKKHSIVAGLPDYAALTHDRYYRGHPLYPWPNRLDAGHYQHAGNHFQLAVNESATGNSLHGFLFRMRPTVVARSEAEHEASITLRYDYAGDYPGYPFPACITLHFQLQTSSGLALTFTVRNLHSATAPLGIGWHPYFSLGESVNQLRLILPKVTRVELDARQLPTGVLNECRDFVGQTRMETRQLDDCFVLATAEASSLSTVLWSDAQHFGIALWQHRHDYPCVHVFIPPDRQSIAIEPVSCGINAFNTGEGLRVLESGEEFSASCGVRVLHNLEA